MSNSTSTSKQVRPASSGQATSMAELIQSKAPTSKGKATSMAELMARQTSTFKTLKKGELVTGSVKKLTPKEILLDIGYKSDALVIEYDKQNLANLLSLLKVGDTVTASVISPESEEGFPVVSLRRMLEEKVYSQLENVFKADTTLNASIAEPTRGGYFVETNEGIKGFLPNSQLMDGKRVNAGDQIEVKIIEFDREKKRVIVSQKAMHYLMNVAEIEKLIKRDSVVKGTVSLVTSYGVYVELKVNDSIVEGFIHISEVSHQRVEGLEGKFKTGDQIEAQVVGIDTENKRVNLSLKKLEKDSFEDVKKKYEKEQTLTATVTDIKGKGVTLEVEPGINAFIASSKVPSGSTYEKGEKVEVEITDFDDKKRLINVTPVMKTKFIGYR